MLRSATKLNPNFRQEARRPAAFYSLPAKGTCGEMFDRWRRVRRTADPLFENLNFELPVPSRRAMTQQRMAAPAVHAHVAASLRDANIAHQNPGVPQLHSAFLKRGLSFLAPNPSFLPTIFVRRPHSCAPLIADFCTTTRALLARFHASATSARNKIGHLC